jgi:hypothetical protein
MGRAISPAPPVGDVDKGLDLDLFHKEGFDDIALLDVLELLEGNAALPTGCSIQWVPLGF